MHNNLTTNVFKFPEVAPQSACAKKPAKSKKPKNNAVAFPQPAKTKQADYSINDDATQIDLYKLLTHDKPSVMWTQETPGDFDIAAGYYLIELNSVPKQWQSINRR